MRLLKTGPYEPGHEKLELIEESGRDIPNYAILSHTWGSDEVAYEHIRNNAAHEHLGYEKIVRAMRQASASGFSYIWIDTCCIDKSSSAELSEALNSMYAWYQNAEMCYALLEDVSGTNAPNFPNAFKASRWFTRGWTLQELLAPRHIIFFGKENSGAWISLGDRVSLQLMIAETTSVGVEYLTGLQDARRASVARRMSWAAGRQTKREEDIAYCLLGLFSINMPLLYGEGSRAFFRLQEEILKRSNDQSIFAWTNPLPTEEAERLRADSHYVNIDWSIRSLIRGLKPKHTLCKSDRHGLLADSPAAFAYSGSIKPCIIPKRQGTPYQMSNQGLSISLPIMAVSEDISVALLECSRSPNNDHKAFLGVFLIRTPGIEQYARVNCGKLVDCLSPATTWLRHHYVRQEVADEASCRPAHLLLLRELRCPTHDYTATDITTTDLFSELYDIQHPLETHDPSKHPASHSWVPAELRRIFRIPDSNVTFFAAIELRRQSDGERLVILIGTGTDATTHLGFAVTDSHNLYNRKALQEVFCNQVHSASQLISAGRHRVTVSVEASVGLNQVVHAIDFDIEASTKDKSECRADFEFVDSNCASDPVQRRHTMFSWLFA